MSRLCSLAFVATMLGYVLTHAEQSPRTQETRRTSVSQSCATAPLAADTALYDGSAPETLAWASADEHRGVCADAMDELSRAPHEPHRDCLPVGGDDSIAYPAEP